MNRETTSVRHDLTALPLPRAYQLSRAVTGAPSAAYSAIAFGGFAPGGIRRVAAAFFHQPKALCGRSHRVLVPILTLDAL